jgi:multiple sugar transport system ATP-binding protein
MVSVTLDGVSKTFPGGVVGLRSTDLRVEAGERLALLGPSGSGKSTLLRLIAGLEDADTGAIHVGGARMERVPPHRRGVAYLPQRVALYPQLTVEQNLAVAANHHEFLELLRLAPLLHRFPHELSGGERQRVALGKLLARDVGVWLLDEPFSGLDPVFRSEFRHDLHLLLDRCKATMLIVTHDPIDALALGRRVGVLGEGRLRQLGTAEELRDHPGNRFVAFCLGRLGLIDGRAVDGEFVSECGSIRLPIPADQANRLGPNVTLGIRPEDISPWRSGEQVNPSRGGAILTGWPVVLAEPAGGGWLLTVARGRSRVRADWRSGSPPPVGSCEDWFLPTDRCVWFET